MGMIDALLGSQADGVVRQIGQQFGLDDSQATSAITALLPALAAGLNQNASSQPGLDALLGALGSGRHAQYVDDVGSLGQPGTIDDGNGILGHIFGSKEVSRQVARQASAQSGIGADVLNISQPNVVDVATVSRQLRGRQCFMMPISYQTVSIQGTPDEILAEAQRLYDLLATPAGGFIGYVEEYGCMGMSPENYRACGEAFRRLRPGSLH